MKHAWDNRQGRPRRVSVGFDERSGAGAAGRGDQSDAVPSGFQYVKAKASLSPREPLLGRRLRFPLVQAPEPRQRFP